MTELQKQQFNKMLATLKRIGHEYSTIEEMQDYEDGIGLDFEETLEMAYENIQAEAIMCIEGISIIS